MKVQKSPYNPVLSQLESPSPNHLLMGWKKCTSKDSKPIGFGQSIIEAPLDSVTKSEPLYLSDIEGHLLTVAPTSRGKGRNAMIPALLSYPGSVVVIDPKGEALEVTGKHRKAMGQRVVVIDPFGIRNSKKRADGLNPLDLYGIGEQSIEDFSMEAAQLLHSQRNSNHHDPFWEIRADSLNAAVIAAALTSENPGDRNLLWVRDLLMKDDAVINLARLLDERGASLPNMAYDQIGSFLQTDEKCRSGILATAIQHFGNLYGAGVEDSIYETTFNLSAYANGEPTSIYFVIPPQKLKSHGSLLRLWVGTLLSVAMNRKIGLDIADLFLMDEAAQLGELESFRSLMTLMRGYSVRCWSFWQDLSQLRQLYRDDWETMLNNAATIQIFGATNHLGAKALAEVIGDGVQPHELLKLSTTEQILLETGGKITYSRKLDYLTDPVFQGLYQSNPRHCTVSRGSGLSRD